MLKKITAITKQKNNNNRVNIYLDGDYAFGLFAINAVFLHVGQSLSLEKIEELKLLDEIEAAFQKAIRFIAYKPRTKFEVSKKLTEAGYSEQVIDVNLSKLVEKGYLNDEQYAGNWIENKSLYKPRSKKLIRFELQQKKIDQEIIEEVVNRMEPEDQLALRAAEKYIRRIENLDEITFKRRFSGFLLRRGFSYSTTKSIVDEYWEKRSQYTTENLYGQEVK
jgi:regulatory protein